MRFKFGLTLILTMLVVVSCARQGTHPAKRLAKSDIETFNIKGEVFWKGATPVAHPIPTTAYQGACGNRRACRPLRLISTRLWYKRLLDVAVWLEPVWQEMNEEDIKNLGRYRGAVVPETLTIEEKGCEFLPKLSMVPVGTGVSVINRDRKDHWLVIEGFHKKREQYVQIFGEAPSVLTLRTPGVHYRMQNEPVDFLADRVDTWHLMSGFHRWMDAWVIVTDKVWFGEVNEKGFFEIEGVPRGVYRVYTWHPLLGGQSVVINVPDDVRKNVGIDYDTLPEKYQDIRSTIISTFGEVREDKNGWGEDDSW